MGKLPGEISWCGNSLWRRAVFCGRRPSFLDKGRTTVCLFQSLKVELMLGKCSWTLLVWEDFVLGDSLA